MGWCKGGMYGVKGDVNFTTPLMESRGVAKIFTTVVSAAGDFFWGVSIPPFKFSGVYCKILEKFCSAPQAIFFYFSVQPSKFSG